MKVKENVALSCRFPIYMKSKFFFLVANSANRELANAIHMEEGYFASAESSTHN